MTRLFALRQISLFLLLVFAQPLAAIAQSDVWSADLESRVAAEMSRLVAAGRISGAVTLVADTQQVLLASSHGTADPVSGRPMTRDAIFRVASMTKPMTATALMKLVIAGKLQLDDQVSEYLPAFAQQRLADGTVTRPITIRDVLTHTAGLPGASGLSGDRTLAQEVDALGALPLQSVPGSRWQYSSGLTVAGRLVEVVSGLPFEQYLHEQICQPLGMQDTAFVLTPAQAQRLAVTCRPDPAGKGLQVVEIPDPTQRRMPNPSGGLYSTADDMAKFFQAVLRDVRGQERGVLGNTQAVQQMLAPQTGELVTGFTPGNAWGLGWCVVRQPQAVTRLLSPGTFGHGGAWGTQAWVDPVRGLVLLLMIQRTEFGNSDASEVRDAFNEAVVSSYHGKPQESARVAPFLGYQNAVHLQVGSTTAVLCPEAGGRVLKFEVAGQDLMFVDERERSWQPGQPPASSAGRFDIGPELVIPKHPVLWSGAWSWEITGPGSARLVSQRDTATGVQLLRDFRLRPSTEDAAKKGGPVISGAVLECRQVIMNVSDRTVEYCHWGRSFSPGGGICVIPVGPRPSRFPSGYVMYEEQGINPSAVDEKIRLRDGFLEILGPPRRPKLGFDSYGGWLAYVLPGNHAFIKRFPASPDRVYNEAAGLTLSVWYPQQGGMIELEPIGPRERLEPGQSAEFTEEWSVGRFPFPAAGQQIDLQQLQQLVESAAAPASVR
jgi:CubicO group peptidase (beta-lactamase class C family)